MVKIPQLTNASGHPDEQQSPLFGKVGLAYTLGHSLWNTYNRAKEAYDAKRRFTVTIKSDDPIYDAVHAWVITLMPQSSKATVVKSTGGNVRTSPIYYDDEDEYTEPKEKELTLLHNDSQSQEFMLHGQRVLVHIEKPDTLNLQSNRVTLAPDSIVFTVYSIPARDAVLRTLKQIANSQTKIERKPALWMLSSYGDWQKRDDLPVRPIESVVLREGQMDGLLNDVREFLGREAEYVRKGIPWHRGYLLYGPPGTGKTSAAKALAAHLKLDLWYAPLGDLDKDTSLLQLINRVRARGVLLLEDIDVLNASHEREGNKGEVSMSGLLNALDGVATPHGLITILTSNNRDVLDEALIRPGRIDRVEEIGLPDDWQVNRLFEVFYGQPAPDVLYSDGRSTAELMEAMKRNMFDADAGYRELTKGEQ